MATERWLLKGVSPVHAELWVDGELLKEIKGQKWHKTLESTEEWAMETGAILVSIAPQWREKLIELKPMIRKQFKAARRAPVSHGAKKSRGLVSERMISEEYERERGKALLYRFRHPEMLTMEQVFFMSKILKVDLFELLSEVLRKEIMK